MPASRLGKKDDASTLFSYPVGEVDILPGEKKPWIKVSRLFERRDTGKERAADNVGVVYRFQGVLCRFCFMTPRKLK